jgi:2-iminoacetate synthase
MHKIGLGFLMGLEDWRTEAFYTNLHLQYLEKTYWKTRYTISFPRLRPFNGSYVPNVTISDRELVQLICAYRICNENVELSLSTRESGPFRDNVIKLGITTVSAGSRIHPGAYAVQDSGLEQFEVSDNRSPADVAAMIRHQGYEPVWKDWDQVLDNSYGNSFR